MKSVVFLSASLLLPFAVFSAEAEGKFPKVWVAHAHDIEDLTRLAQLVDASGLIAQARCNLLNYRSKSIQYRAQTSCQYGTLLGFSKFLSSTKDKIHNESLKNQLTRISERVENICQDHKPYDLKWSENKSQGKAIAHDLSKLYTSVSSDLLWISRANQKFVDYNSFSREILREFKQPRAYKSEISLGKLLEDYFMNYPRDLIRLTGMSKNDPNYLAMAQSLNAQVLGIKRRFEDSDIAQEMGPEKIAQYWFSLNITEPKNAKGSFNKKPFIMAFVTLTVALMPAYESVKSEEFKLEFANDSEFTRSDTTKFANMIYAMMVEKIPQLKKSVYAQANLLENQQLLYDLVAPVLNKHALEDLVLTGGQYLKATRQMLPTSMELSHRVN